MNKYHYKKNLNNSLFTFLVRSIIKLISFLYFFKIDFGQEEKHKKNFEIPHIYFS